MVGLRRRHLVAALNPNSAVTISATATLTAEVHANRPLYLSGTTAQTYTLPLATGSGNTYTFHVLETNESNLFAINAAGSDEFNGMIMATDADAETEGPGWPALAADNFSVVTIGDTTRGLLGSWVQFRDVASGVYFVSGQTAASGSEATPFT
ncbi:hypothetical protein LCGC14_2212410 [marine sediment metagenome]|uniref:Uncharacterized protein n=1 Tax=marine sediment metagenome TaxID=412755 RepID=A0A0F9DDB0_9ZZZZ